MEIKKTLIFDFDGVISSKSDLLARFLANYLYFGNIQEGQKKVIKSALNNKKQNFITSIFRKFGAKKYFSFLQKTLFKLDKNDQLGIKSELIEFLKFHQDKFNLYLLTSNYKNIVEFSLGENINLFSKIATFDNNNSKSEAIENWVKNEDINLENVIFVTDTAGDVKEFLQFVPEKQIIGVDWGFHDRHILLKEINSKQVFSTPSDLIEFLTNSLN
jgi:phosphoglycolate phosphatase-like HAD superfamily hydrolase